MTISVAVSFFLFLAAALFMDFSYATYSSGTKRIQSNRIYINTQDESVANKIATELKSYNVVENMHCSAQGFMETTTGLQLRVSYNIIELQNGFGDYIHSGLEMYGDTDSANEHSFEKYKVIYGSIEKLSYENVAISEEFAKIMYQNPKDAVGNKIVVKYDGADVICTVVAVYSEILTETRLNKDISNCIKSGEEPSDDEDMITTIIASQDTFKNVPVDSYDIYVYYPKESYDVVNSYMTTLSSDESYRYKFSYYTKDSIQIDNDEEWMSNMQVKSILLLVVAIISGISICGTMVNSISERKKEIGIKKALGASDGKIMVGFVYENIINCLVAIVIAIALASMVLLAYVYYQRQVLMIDYQVRVYGQTVMLFLIYAFSSVFGFSLLPAYSATQVNIIDTLRDE
jgi:putative ABC transport system permease protein